MDILFAILLLIATYTDLKKREIPDKLSIAIVVLALFDFHPLGLLSALPFLVAAMINPEGIGGGDIKLTAAVGLYLGFSKTLVGVVLALILSIITYWVLCIGKQKQEVSKAMPLAPFLTIGFLAVTFI